MSQNQFHIVILEASCKISIVSCSSSSCIGNGGDDNRINSGDGSCVSSNSSRIVAEVVAMIVVALVVVLVMISLIAVVEVMMAKLLVDVS